MIRRRQRPAQETVTEVVIGRARAQHSDRWSAVVDELEQRMLTVCSSADGAAHAELARKLVRVLEQQHIERRYAGVEVPTMESGKRRRR